MRTTKAAVTESHHGSISHSSKTWPTTSDLTPWSDFPKEHLQHGKGCLLCEEGCGGIQKEAGTMKSRSVVAEAKPVQAQLPCFLCQICFPCLLFLLWQQHNKSTWRTKLKITLSLVVFRGASSQPSFLCQHVHEHLLDIPEQLSSLGWTLIDFSTRRALIIIQLQKHTAKGTLRVVPLSNCSVCGSSTCALCWNSHPHLPFLLLPLHSDL